MGSRFSEQLCLTEPREMTRQLRVLVALPGDSGLSSSTHISAPGPGNLTPAFGLLRYCTHDAHTYMQ